jgi:type II secretory pathway pseudopilin PulG
LSGPGDRYEPLPGFLSLPAFLIRRLGPRGRVVLAIVAGVALVGAVAAALVLVPRITESKRESAAEARRDAARALAERRRALEAEQRPQRGAAAAGTERAGVLTELESAILTDARERVADGDLPGPPAKRVECEPLRHGALDSYDCIAVTSDLPEIETSPAGVVGHPFRALIDFDRGRFTWCKVSGRAGEGSFTGEALVTLPRACGG